MKFSEKLKTNRRKAFAEDFVDGLVREAAILDISIEEIIELIKQTNKEVK